MPSTFEELDTPALIDLLAKQTSEYTAYLRDGIDSPEFHHCKAWMKILQKEINLRKATDYAISVTDMNITFEKEDENIAGPV
jgi:mannitol-1-phosphate/altronate dehydrogenase